MKWARPTGSPKSSWKLKAHRSTRSFVGTATLRGQAGPVRTAGTVRRDGRVGGRALPPPAHLAALMVQ